MHNTIPYLAKILKEVIDSREDLYLVLEVGLLKIMELHAQKWLDRNMQTIQNLLTMVEQIYFGMLRGISVNIINKLSRKRMDY